MQSKGAIKFFALAFAIVCIFQLSFTYMVSRVETEAKEFAGGDFIKERAFLDSMRTEPVYNLGVKKFTYQDCKSRELNLGLDLKGGMHVTLEISVEDLIKNMSNYSTNATFTKAIELAKENQKKSRTDFVTLFQEAFEQLDPNAKLAAIFSTRELSDRISFDKTNDEVILIIRKETDDAIDRTFKILRTRIDQFGVTQPTIQKQEGTGRITVELPGVDDQQRVRKILQNAAKLEFWETYDNVETVEFLSKANDILSQKFGLEDSASKSESNDSISNIFSKNEVAVNDTSGKNDNAVAIVDSAKDVGLTLLEKMKDEDTSKANDTSASSKSFEEFSKENPLYAVLQPAVYTDQDGVSKYRSGPVIGYSIGRDTAKVNAYLKMEEIKAVFPKNMRFLWTAEPLQTEKPVYELLAVKVTRRDGRAALEGDAISDARQDFGFETGQPEISMTMNTEGARVWKRLTAEASKDKDNKKSIAVVLDNMVRSYPVVQGEIPNGRSSITGSFTIEEAKDIANILKAGKLPAPAKIVQEEIVGPSLGKESIEMGFISMVAGVILVIIFMIVYYSSGGFYADLTLLVNLFFILGVLASLGAALTLPGIAGIVLTMGMAVDANVLIYERIREEIEGGKGIKMSVVDGFKNAYSSIIDSNVTTLLTGIILYTFGSGPVQGFATVLIIGILTSMFTAIFITRLLLDWQISREKPIQFSTKLTKNLLRNKSFDFIGNRKIAYVCSSIIIVAGIISLFTKGLNYGVDFKGGRSYVVRFDEPKNTVDLRTALTKSFEGSPTEVKTFGQNNQIKITTAYKIEDKTTDVDSIVEVSLFKGLSSFMKENTSINDFKENYSMSSQKVGPTIAQDIKTGAFWSIILSLIVIFIYILIRFRQWQYSLGATIALVHDAMIVISLFSIFYGILPFSLEIDQAFIAAILTVIGYSINDTVVVFDRIREYLNIHHGAKKETVINDAINNTLSRTINTSLTTLITVIVLFIFGGDVLKGFSFALLVGITVGTYSSIFIAAPLVIDFGKKNKE